MDNQYRTNEFLSDMVRNTANKTSLLQTDLKGLKYIKNVKIRQLNQFLRLEELENDYASDITYQIEELFFKGNIEIKKYTVKISEKLVMPVYVTNPVQANGRTVLYLHGHDPLGVKGVFTTCANKEPYHKNIPLKMTKAGFRVIVPELIGQGEAIYEYFLKGKPAIGTCLFNYAISTLCGYDLTAIRVWQTMKVIDFIHLLGYRLDILFGVSGGGLVSQLVAALDDEVENIIISSYANTYENSILAKEQCIDNYIHGMNQIGNSYEILVLTAPKRLLLVNGTSDTSFPLAGTKKAFDYMKNIYKKYYAEDKLQTCIFEGRHEINSELVMEWLQQFQ